MNKPYFTEDDFINEKNHNWPSRESAADMANNKIAPLLDKLERYEKACLELRKHSRHSHSCDSMYTEKSCDCGYNKAVELFETLENK